MKLATAAATLLLSAATRASAFTTPKHVPGALLQQSRRAFASSTPLAMANVLKLSEPQSELLDQVDVFIFDCDGVIWRVSGVA